MEKRNKIFIIIVLGILTILIVFGSINKVYKMHTDKMVMVVENKLKESAKQCFLDGKCKDGQTTVGELIKLGYLEEGIVNPVTKEKLSNYVLITYEDDECYVSLR